MAFYLVYLIIYIFVVSFNECNTIIVYNIIKDIIHKRKNEASLILRQGAFDFV